MKNNAVKERIVSQEISSVYEQSLTWKAIPGYHLYEINQNGIVRRRLGGKIVPWTYCTNGYPQVSMANDDGKRTTKTVHKLVVTTFIRALQDGEEINHKDLKRHNPRLDNLEIMASKKEHFAKYHRHTENYKKCPMCGAETHCQEYCSRECREKGLNTEKTCVVCGNKFFISKKHLDYGINVLGYEVGVYCSNKCRFAGAGLKKRKLSDEQAIYIKSLLDVMSIAEVANKTGLKYTTVKNIKIGITYKIFPNTNRLSLPSCGERQGR